MKQSYSAIKILFTLIAFAGLAVCITSCDSNAETGKAKLSEDPLAVPALFERQGELAKTAEWPKTKEKIAELLQKIGKNSSDVKSRLQIAVIYISEARVTGQQNYYYPAIHKVLDGVLALEPKNFEALVYKASVKMSQHQFAEAKTLADKARTLNPDNAYVYGVLVDANVELGKYEEAIAMSDKMQALKPSLESYSRASYLREIFGDYPGAIKAMSMAVAAGVPGSESAEWSRTALADLYLNTGRLDSAENLYKMSLDLRPAFPGAEIGLAKVAKVRKNYTAAIEHTENAIRIVSEASYVSLLGDVYLLQGNKEKATEIYNDVADLLAKGEKEQAAGDAVHNGSRELASAYLNAGQLDKALEYAKKDLAIRPDNIDANELLAWIAYIKGDNQLALSCVDKMLRTNTLNANYLYIAGLIYAKAGDKAKASMLQSKALSVNKYIDAKILMAAK